MIEEIRKDEGTKPILGTASNTSDKDTAHETVQKRILETKAKITELVKASDTDDPKAQQLRQSLGLLIAMEKSLSKSAEIDSKEGPANVDDFLKEFDLKKSSYLSEPLQQNTLGPPGWVWLLSFLVGWTLPLTLGISWIVPAFVISGGPDPSPIVWWWMGTSSFQIHILHPIKFLIVITRQTSTFNFLTKRHRQNALRILVPLSISSSIQRSGVDLYDC